MDEDVAEHAKCMTMVPTAEQTLEVKLIFANMQCNAISLSLRGRRLLSTPLATLFVILW